MNTHLPNLSTLTHVASSYSLEQLVTRTSPITTCIPRYMQVFVYTGIGLSTNELTWERFDFSLSLNGHKRSRGVMVSTQDSESCDPSSNLGGTCYVFTLRKTQILFPSVSANPKDSLHNNRPNPRPNNNNQDRHPSLNHQVQLSINVRKPSPSADAAQ